jgi:hypothetical protein
MKTSYLSIGLVWLCCFLGGQEYSGRAMTSRVTATSADITLAPETAGQEAPGATPMEPGDPLDERVDILGNDVENAVEDYRIDLGGTIYERHSPETMVAKLAAPSS